MNMNHRVIFAVLAGLLMLFQAQLWFGRGSLSDVTIKTKQLAKLTDTNDRLKSENQLLKAEVEDLKTGMNTVEEKARSELGMLKPNEILIQFTK
jgi:cell division protein FtsB